MSGVATLTLIAHAVTPAMRAGCFPNDDPLDERGLAEAAAVAATAGQAPWHAVGASATVLCSPAQCAQQTAAALGLHARPEPALRDLDYGDWRGRRLHDLLRDTPTLLDAWLHDATAAPHGGESFADVLLRVGAWMDGLRAPGATVAVTHAVVVRAALAHALHNGAQAMLQGDVAPLSCVRFTSTGAHGWERLAG